MGKRIYTNVSPKAYHGIQRVYGGMGARVRALVGPTGELVVEVTHPSIKKTSHENDVLRTGGEAVQPSAA